MKYGLLYIVMILFALCSVSASAGERNLDIMLLMDESGSMKQTDPANARGDAADLFVMLCGPANQVGLIGFATDVRVIADSQAMGPGAARDTLLQELDGIRSVGKYTDIEKVLRLALDQLTRSAAPGEKAVILLTDGKVDTGDVSRDSASVQAIRGAILSDYLQAKVKIYCVAFSRESDWTLLDYLSRQTGALAVRGNDPEQLRQLFLRLFEEITQPQSVPLEDSSALLDPSVNEVTFVVTHPKADQTLRVVSPDGTKRIEQKNADRYEGVSWFASPSCDIITIKRPDAGKWRIEPPVTNPSDRVLILTDMELSVKGWEGTAHRGEVTTATACLETKEGIVQKPEMVSRLNIRGTLKAASESSCIFADNGNGMYGGSLKMPDAAGRHDIEIIAKSPTFERRVLKNVNVFDQLYTVEAESRNLHAGESIVLKIVANDKAAHSKMDFEATIQLPDGTRSKLEVIPVDESLFSVAFEDTKKGGDYRITVMGTLGEGADAYQEVFGPLDVHVAAEAPEEVALPPMDKASHETPATTGTEEKEPEEKEPTEAHAPAPAAPANGLFTPLNLAIAGGGLLLLGVIALQLAILIMRRPKAAPEPKLPVEELRKRAAAIREEAYDVPPVSIKLAAEEKAEEAHVEKDEAEVNLSQEANQGFESSFGDDLIPAVESEEEEVAEDNEAKVLVEVRETQAPGGTISGSASESLSEDEESLLAEIMGEISDDAPKVPVIDKSAVSGAKIQPEAEAESNIEADEMQVVIDPDAAQLALEKELLGELGEGDDQDSVPTIADGKDEKTDQEAIDDILSQIQNMIDK